MLSVRQSGASLVSLRPLFHHHVLAARLSYELNAVFLYKVFLRRFS